MQIDPKAAAIAECRILINAPLHRVWQLQTEIDRWSEWNPAVRRARLEGPLAVGSVFRWKSGGTSIVSTLAQVEPMSELAWTGRSFGIRAAHTWSFRRQGKSVAVVTRESFDGWVPRLLSRAAQAMLAATLRTWLKHLKQAAESAPR